MRDSFFPSAAAVPFILYSTLDLAAVGRGKQVVKWHFSPTKSQSSTKAVWWGEMYQLSFSFHLVSSHIESHS